MTMVGEVETAQPVGNQGGWWVIQHGSGSTTAYRDYDRAVRGAVSAGVSLPVWSAEPTLKATK